MKRRYHLHIPGLVYLALTIIVGLIAINSGNNHMFWVFGVLVTGVLISGVYSGFMMRGVRIRRLDPQHGAVGEPLFMRYELTNRNWLLPIFNVQIEERPLADEGGWSRFMLPAGAWIMHTAARDASHGEAIFWPERRGEVRFDRVRVWTTFPFGLIKKSVSIGHPQHTLIYPRVYELRRGLLSAVMPVGPLGMRVANRAGPGDEYFGMRDYRPGDSMRQIAWKRAAGLDQLICVERTQPSPPKLRIVLNLATPTKELRTAKESEQRARAMEERAISLAASLVRMADREGYEVGLAVMGMNVPRIPMRRNHWHVEKIMAALAGIDLDTPRDDWRLAPLPAYERSGRIVVHPDEVNPALAGPEAYHLTGRQLRSLAQRAVGWRSTASTATEEANGPPGSTGSPGKSTKKKQETAA